MNKYINNQKEQHKNRQKPFDVTVDRTADRTVKAVGRKGFFLTGLFLALSAGMSLSTYAQEDYTVCTVNGEELLNSDFQEKYDYYVQTFQSSGYDTDSEEVQEYIKECVYDAAINALLLEQGMTEDGYYDFSEEELTEFSEQGETEYQEYLEYYIQYYEEKYEEEQEEAYADAENCAREALEEAGITAETLAEGERENEATEKFQEELMKEVSFSEEEIQEYYEELIETDRERYESIATYEYDRYFTSGTIWYTPEGYRHILQLVLEEEDEELEQKLEEIEAGLAENKSFEELAEEYSTEDPETGFDMHESSVVWSDEVLETVFSDDMTEPGDVSEPLTQDGKVYLFYYESDVPSGATELTEDGKEELKERMEEEELQNRTDAYVEALRENAEITEEKEPEYAEEQSS